MPRRCQLLKINSEREEKMLELKRIEIRLIQLLENFNPEQFIVSPLENGMRYTLSGYINDVQKKAHAEYNGICVAIVHDSVQGPYILAEHNQTGVKFILFNAEETFEQEGAIKVILNSEDGTHKWVKYCPGGIA